MATREGTVVQVLEMALYLVVEMGTGREAPAPHSVEVEVGAVATETVSMVMTQRGHLGEIMSATVVLAEALG